MELVAVAAVGENLVIGSGGEIPWESLPADKRQYRERVADDTVILGRRTFESMRADLPGNAQIVLSRQDRSFDAETTHHARDVAEAIDVAEELGAETAYVLGGGAIYDIFQLHLDRMVLSRVPGEHEGDVYYPAWDSSEWELVEEISYDSFTLQEWERQR